LLFIAAGLIYFRLRMTKNRLPRYVIVGACAYTAEMISLYGLIKVASFTPITAVAVSFWIGFIVAFMLQKLITFKNYEKKPRALVRQLVLYGLLVVWNYGFTLLVVALLTPMLSAFVARTGAIVAIATWNFIIYRHIFKTKSLQEQYSTP
jgi:putative flippase GtrA